MAFFHFARGEKFSRNPERSCSADAVVCNQGRFRAAVAVGRWDGLTLRRARMNCLAESETFRQYRSWNWMCAWSVSWTRSLGLVERKGEYPQRRT
jgi:hypothetical protein